MRRLPCPATRAREVVDLCVESIRDDQLKERLRHVLPHIETAELAYLACGPLADLYTIVGTDTVAGHVSTEEMKRVYKDTFVRSRRTRHIYDAIKKAPRNDICPLCEQRTVSTLDHYLPQSNHPSLTVVAANLVPACSECNKIKLAIEAADANDQTLHPYFDEIDERRWLFATVQEKRPASVTFYADPPESPLRARITRHFAVFQLAKLYASHAAVEINDLRFGLEKIIQSGTKNDVRHHLQETAQSCAHANPNSWRRAMYEGLIESEWFCSGGFLS